MTKNLISVIDIANIQGRDKQYVFKILRRKGIKTTLEKSSSTHGQKIAYVTQEEYALLKDEITIVQKDSEKGNSNARTKGVSYLIQLEPQLDPGRFKLGFATNVKERLRSHKTSAPYSKVIKTWPCKQLWEKTAIESVTQDCKQIHTEVFQTKSIDSVIIHCDKFFELMPKL